jgi:hypothetical protein
MDTTGSRLGGSDDLVRRRADLVARAERLRLWSRLARARMDLLVAQVCPPDEDGLGGLASLVLDDDRPAADPVEQLLALREARRELARRREALDDDVCWSTAVLVLDGPPEPTSPSARPGALARTGVTPGAGLVPRPRREALTLVTGAAPRA